LVVSFVVVTASASVGLELSAIFDMSWSHKINR
jgi:hypothetical protein